MIQHVAGARIGTQWLRMLHERISGLLVLLSSVSVIGGAWWNISHLTFHDVGATLVLLGFITAPGLAALGLALAYIARLRRTEKALRTSEELFRLAVQGTNDGLWDWNPGTNEIYLSPRYKELLGYAEHEFANSFASFASHVHPGDYDRVMQAVNAHLTQRVPYDVELRMRTKSGEYRWFNDRAQAVWDTAGRPLRMVGFQHDITDRKRMEAEQAHLLRQAEAAETRFRTLLESAPEAIVLTDLNGIIVLVNHQTEKLFGSRREELLGKSVERLMPESLRQAHVRHRASYLSNPQVRPMGSFREVPAQRADGSEFPAEISLSPIESNGERLIMSVIRDMAERKRTADAIKESQERFRTIAEMTPIPLVISRVSDGLILYANERLGSILGLPVTELIGKKSPDFYYDPADRQAVFALLSERETLHDYELRLKKPDGASFWGSLSIRKITFNGEPALASSIYDLTDRRQIEQNLRQAKEEAETASRLKSEFLATMSHEIRTPMNGIIGMTGLLLDTDLTPEQREYAETVKHSADTLLTIINDILDFSKVEAGKLVLEIIDFDLRVAIEETLDLLAPQAHEKGLELTCLVHADVPTAVRGDPGRLRQILLNLLNNAIKFTHRGEVIIEVKSHEEEIRDRRPETCPPSSQTSSLKPCVLYFAVRDTGIGIPTDRRDCLFHAFSQVDSSTTRKYGGTGLGLSISKRLVELMGGKIGVESEPGKGSTFWFTARLERQAGDMQSAPLPHATLHGLRVLVVDDNTASRAALSLFCASWEMECDGVADSAHGLEQLRAAAAQGQPYHVALLDSQMPDMDGLELARAIKADPALATLKLVLLPTIGLRGEAQQAQEAGVDAYLTKPIRQSQLFDCLTTVIGSALLQEPSSCAPFVTRHTLTEIKSRNRPLILVVEDNAVNQKLAVRLLDKLGYRADVAANGREALDALARISYAAVLMDCQMPEMDGYEATQAIRAREATTSPAPHDSAYQTLNSQTPDARRIPIIAMTANAMQGDKERCLAAGMDDYISKPVNSTTLKAVLARWITNQESEDHHEDFPTRDVGALRPVAPRQMELEEAGCDHLA